MIIAEIIDHNRRDVSLLMSSSRPNHALITSSFTRIPYHPQGDDPGKLAENFAKTYGLDAEMKAQVPAIHVLHMTIHMIMHHIINSLRLNPWQLRKLIEQYMAEVVPGLAARGDGAEVGVESPAEGEGKGDARDVPAPDERLR